MKILRTLSLSLSVLLPLSAVHTAHAQASIYGTISGTVYSDVHTDGLLFNGIYPGYGGGLTYIFVQRAVTVGIDLRDTVTPNTSGGNTAAVSVRLGFVPQQYPCHPYFQIGPGFISAKVPAGYGTAAQTLDTAAVAVAWGLDVRVAPSLDIRAIEIGVDAGNKNSSAIQTTSFSAGIVYHFPHPQTKNP